MSEDNTKNILRSYIVKQAESSISLRIPLCGHSLVDKVKKRARVEAGALLATHTDPRYPYVHAPLSGLISEVCDEYIELDHTGVASAEEVYDLVAAMDHDFASTSVLEGRNLREALYQRGVSTHAIPEEAKLLLISAYPADAGIAFCEDLLRDCKDILETGLTMLSKICMAENTLLCVPDESYATLTSIKAEIRKLEYPQTLDPLLIKSVTGMEYPEGVHVISLLDLFYLGYVADSGLPLSVCLVSVQGHSLVAFCGSKAKDLFNFISNVPESGSVLVLGGAMRGRSLSDLEYGIGSYDQALFWCEKEQWLPLEDNPCISCGRCVSVCPVGLRPDLLGKYAEFSLYDYCSKEHLSLCLECGMCGFICPAQRPMQQYFFDAKTALGLPSYQMLAQKQRDAKKQIGGIANAK